MEKDYSGTLRSAARLISKAGQHSHRIGTLLGRLPGSVNIPKAAPPPAPPTAGHPKGTVQFDGFTIAAWIAPVLHWARAHGWDGHVTSGYRSVAQQREACRHVCGNPNGCPGKCAKPGTSNHQFTDFPRGAVDVSDAGGLTEALRRYPGGAPIRHTLPKDLVHFSHTGS